MILCHCSQYGIVKAIPHKDCTFGDITGKSEVLPQTVMIGDRKHDVLGAKECRVPCIGVRYGYAEAGELEQYGADWVTDSVKTLGKLLL